MPNSTITVTQTSTTAITLTGTTTTHTVQAAPFLLYGLPPELLALFALVVGGIVFAFFRFQVKGVPVQLVWIYKNGAAIMLKCKEDLQGIFLEVIKGGKSIETIKKKGLPLQVRYTPGNFKAYMEVPKDKTLEDSTLTELRKKGFKISPEKHDRKGRIKAYLVQKEASVESALAYLDVNLGGLKTARLYASIEGTGETIDWEPRIAKASEGDDTSGNTILLQEMKTAAKGFFQLLAEAMQGSLKTLLIPLVAGVGIGGMLVFILVILSGHLK